MYTLLYIVIAAMWCLLACVAFAICRLAAVSDDAHTLELAEWLASGGRRRHKERRAGARSERLTDDRRKAWRATG